MQIEHHKHILCQIELIISHAYRRVQPIIAVERVHRVRASVCIDLVRRTWCVACGYWRWHFIGHPHSAAPSGVSRFVRNLSMGWFVAMPHTQVPRGQVKIVRFSHIVTSVNALLRALFSTIYTIRAARIRMWITPDGGDAHFDLFYICYVQIILFSRFGTTTIATLLGGMCENYYWLWPTRWVENVRAHDAHFSPIRSRVRTRVNCGQECSDPFLNYPFGEICLILYVVTREGH